MTMMITWNVAGLAQYIAVGSYILFFGSYAMDFAAIQVPVEKDIDKMTAAAATAAATTIRTHNDKKVS